MEAVLSGGPWFLNGHIVGMEKWTPKLSPMYMKGLTSPIWVKMTHLPLHYWDEKNIARIASMIGKPLILDGNLFQWGRREFARVCMRVKIDQSLPLRVWVKSISRRFFQKVEYEKIASFFYHCGMIGHDKAECNKGKSIQKEVEKADCFCGVAPEGGNKSEDVNLAAFGSWVLVNHKRNRRTIQRNNLMKPNVKYVKKQDNPIQKIRNTTNAKNSIV
ncbi:hypothetical protein KFK09_024030 [Dendrobium nobile]|uniref:Zinc knuckle CX2CX4HX4C domain-containing protein n=1 Tax=Dendrobium nobile TaxID=94219 RepID=A0A8T3ACX1_DENNO|nr:hypothetical protein KFK09_024030 [Dendrobium nobile]